MTPRLLDLFCGGGAAAKGYADAGFDIVGVDIAPHPGYPYEFHQWDAMELLAIHVQCTEAGWPIRRFDAIHASPPCQDHSATRVLGGGHGTGWMLTETRRRLQAIGLPWVLENVGKSALARQGDLFGANGLELCGCMFPGLRGLLYELRRFETSFPVAQPPHALHQWRTTKMGRPPRAGECMQVTGHFSDVAEARRRMGCKWMTRDELAQAIPPPYTRFVGEQLLEHLQERAA
jgi:DNA (cytosine-5)-methyltransferase 1